MLSVTNYKQYPIGFYHQFLKKPGALLNIREFECIWRWLIFKRIVSDNEDNHRNLFVDDEFWGEFER